MRFTVAAQFGGRDVADALLPHRKALLAKLSDMPDPPDDRAVQELAIILRGDGNVNAFGLEGYGNLECDVGDKAISVDVGVPLHRWQRNTPAEIASFLVDSILASLPAVATLASEHGLRLDESQVERHMLATLRDYRRGGL